MAQKKPAARSQSRATYVPGRASMLAAASLAALLLAAGCGGGLDKAGGADKAGGTVTAAPVELRVVKIPGQEAQPFLDELARLSGGTLRMTGDEQFERGQLNAETDALRAVQSGQADIAIVPTRAYDFIGVKSFDALMDPMLIDNMELQQQVLNDSVATDMLEGVSSAGLTGIGILPGPIRLPNGITRRLLGPASYSGARIAFTPSSMSKRSLRALGAVPVESPFQGADVSGFDGLEQQASSVAGNEYDGVVAWITANVGLWARPLAIVANTDSWGKLSKTQQGWLVQAAKTALPASVALVGDTEEIANMCRRNRVKIISASDRQIAQLRDAFSPVDRWLRTDGTAAGYLDRIQAIKSELGARVSGQPIDCAELTHQSASSSDRAGSASAIDGNYSLSYTVKEMHAGASPDEVGAENWGDFRLVLDRGRFAITQHNTQSCTWNYGTFTFDGKILKLSILNSGGAYYAEAANEPGELFDYNVSSYHNYMNWSAVPDAVSPRGYTIKPWHRTSTKPSTDYLEKQCLPPVGWDG